jgi:hypothetical protein
VEMQQDASALKGQKNWVFAVETLTLTSDLDRIRHPPYSSNLKRNSTRPKTRSPRAPPPPPHTHTPPSHPRTHTHPPHLGIVGVQGFVQPRVQRRRADQRPAGCDRVAVQVGRQTVERAVQGLAGAPPERETSSGKEAKAGQ